MNIWDQLYKKDQEKILSEWEKNHNERINGKSSGGNDYSNQPSGSNNDYFSDAFAIFNQYDELRQKELLEKLKKRRKGRKGRKGRRGDYSAGDAGDDYFDDVFRIFDQRTKREQDRLLSKWEQEHKDKFSKASDTKGQDYSNTDAGGDHCTYDCQNWPYSNCRVSFIASPIFYQTSFL